VPQYLRILVNFCGICSLGLFYVHLADELTTECVDDTGDGRSLSLADKVKVEHTLDSARLQTVDETSGLWVEEEVLWVWGCRPCWSSEAGDLVVWLGVC